MRSCVRVVTVAATGALLAFGGQAVAQPSRPASVGIVTVDKATSSSLSISWREAPGAGDYVIERGADVEMVNRVVVSRTTSNRSTITGLQPGNLYCFQVRGVNSAGLGARSPRACQRTVAAEGTDEGQVYRVLTYNLCSRVCPGWKDRRADAAALVAARRPDVVMLTEAIEDSGMASAIGGMKQVVFKSGKALLYRRHAFTVAELGGERRTGFLDLGSHRFAVWAELVDRTSHQHVVFVGVHLSAGKDTAEADAHRRQEATNLVAGLREINPAGVPIVVAGDFNSYEQRRFDSPTEVMGAAGFANSYWRARSWRRGNYNSGNHGTAIPDIGKVWGRHIDQVWAQPGRTQVLRWRNAAAVKDGRYVPLPSNHNPILVRLRINS